MECKECPYYDTGLCGQYCDKVGGKCSLNGYCTDVEIEECIQTQEYHSKQQKRNKRERDKKHKNRLKFLANYATYYPAPVTYKDTVFIKGQGYIKNPKPYYKRLYRGKHSKYLKKMSNKKIRRFNGILAKKGNHSHRLFDFWWELS